MVDVGWSVAVGGGWLVEPIAGGWGGRAIVCARGGGVCVGMRVAHMEIYLLVVTLLRYLYIFVCCIFTFYYRNNKLQDIGFDNWHNCS